MKNLILIALVLISWTADGQFRRYSSIPATSSGPATWAPLQIKTINNIDLRGTGNVILDFVKRNDTTQIGNAGYEVAIEVDPTVYGPDIILKDKSNSYFRVFSQSEDDPSELIQLQMSNGYSDDGFGGTVVSRGFQISTSQGSISNSFTVNPSDFQFSLSNASGPINMSMSAASGFVITDGRGTKDGLKYAASGYVTNDRSLTDKAYVDAAVASGDVTYTSGKKVRTFTRALNEVLSSTSGSMGAAVFASEVANGESVTITVQWAAKDDNTNTGAGSVFISTWTKAGGTLQKVHDNNLGTSTSDTGDALVLSTSDVSGDITVSIGTGSVAGNFSASGIATVVIRKP